MEMNMEDHLKCTDGNMFVRVTLERCVDNDGWVSVIAHVGDDCLNCGDFHHMSINPYIVMNAMRILFGGFAKTTTIHKRDGVEVDMLFYMDGAKDWANITMVEVK